MSAISHAKAVSIELQLRQVLGCERFGFGGIANSDSVELGGAYTAIASALSVRYVSGSEELRARIDAFLEQWSQYQCRHLNEVIEERGEDWVDASIDQLNALIRE